jgi:hypothetical protein
MSATKEFLLTCTEWQQSTDQALYETARCMASLSSHAWLCGDDHAVYAPDAEWLAETRQQLKDLEAMLGELHAARECLDYDS